MNNIPSTHLNSSIVRACNLKREEVKSFHPTFRVGSTVPSVVSEGSDSNNCSSHLENTTTSLPATIKHTNQNTHVEVTKKAINRKFRPYQCEKWQERFCELLEYRKKHGNCLVPHRHPQNPSLAGWVKRQRYQYGLFQQGKKSTITRERIRILNNYGFVWDSHEAVWQERLRELQIYKERNGNCAVPCHYAANPKLGTWVKCQKRQHKLYMEGRPSNMNAERILALECLDFEWEGRYNKFSNESKMFTTTFHDGCEGTNPTDYDIMLDVLSILSDGVTSNKNFTGKDSDTQMKFPFCAQDGFLGDRFDDMSDLSEDDNSTS